MLIIPFCVVKIGIKTYVLIFKFVAGVNRECLWELIFCLCSSFFFLFDKFHYVFYLCLNSIRCVYRKIFLNIVDVESDLHRGHVVVDYNTLIL